MKLIRRVNDALERFEREHPILFMLAAIPVCAVGVVLVTWAPLLWPTP